MSALNCDVPPDGTDPRSADALTTWVDRELLAGTDEDVCLHLGTPLTRIELRQLVESQQSLLAEAGLRAGGTVALHLPPSLGYVASLLAAWRLGAQVSLLDHRLSRAEVDRALDRLTPQVVVEARDATNAPMSGYATRTAQPAARPGGVAPRTRPPR